MLKYTWKENFSQANLPFSTYGNLGRFICHTSPYLFSAPAWGLAKANGQLASAVGIQPQSSEISDIEVNVGIL